MFKPKLVLMPWIRFQNRMILNQRTPKRNKLTNLQHQMSSFLGKKSPGSATITNRRPSQNPKRKRKQTNPNKHKSNKRTKNTKISSLFPKRGNRNTKRIEKHKNKMTHGKTYNKSPRRINHKATKNKTNTGTTALERSVE